jgi:hypothetical protein
VIEKEDDFGHEMRVGGALRNHIANVEHGGTYLDPLTQKPRQFDYRCSLRREAKCLSLAVECKNLSPAVPLIISGTARAEGEAFHDLIESRIGVRKRGSAIVAGASSITRRASREHAFYAPGQFVGKSVSRIETDKNPMERLPDREIYEKWTQALSSAVGLAESACRLAEVSFPTVTTAILPVLVVPDGVLWSANYDDNGRMPSDPATSDECELFLGKEIELGQKGTPLFHRFKFSHVHFFTLKGLGSFLSKMALNEHAWSRLFTDKAAEL